MEGQSSHALVNLNSGANTSSDAGNGIRCTHGDMAWEWGEWKDPTKKGNILCTLCGKKMSGGITRLKQHLTHTKGDVTGCSKVTTDITKRVLASVHEKEKITKEKKRNIEILRSENTVDDLLWSDVREAIGGNVDIEPSTRSKRERYRDDNDEISMGVGLEEEVNALDDVDSDAEPLDCN
ncbi:zinc finger protein [Tanacetum coccineum]